MAVRSYDVGEIMQANSERALNASGADAPAPPGGGWQPRRLGVISNPKSGRNRRRMATIYGFLAGRGQIPHLDVLDAADVNAALAAFARDGIDLVALNSGDGTVQAALTTLFNQRPFGDAPPLLALLSGGTTNMTHRDLGLSGPRVASLKRLIAWADHGTGQATLLTRPVLRVRRPAPDLPLYGMFFGAACIYGGIELFHSRVRGLGLRGGPAQLVILARLLAALAAGETAVLKPAAAEIRVDGTRLAPRRFMFITVHTLDGLIFGLRPFWGEGRGALRLTAISAPPRRFMRVLPSLLWGRRTRHTRPENGYFSFNSDQIRLALDGGFALDGERFRADPHQGELILDVGGQATFLRV
ncbi:MAG: acylglycerol kinase family protein [Desulfobacteraceae bacterium]|nr:acylglycerol kinase family protein [Desulfobacteraceae bacterium]